MGARALCSVGITSSTPSKALGVPSPAFFALAIQTAVEDPHICFIADWEVWYHDDEGAKRQNLAGHARASHKLGLSVILDKCKLWSPSGFREDTTPLKLADWTKPSGARHILRQRGSSTPHYHPGASKAPQGPGSFRTVS